MTKVVNNPVPAAELGGSGISIATILVLGFFILVSYFGIPVLKQRMWLAQVNVVAPQVIISDRLDVNVQQK